MKVKSCVHWSDPFIVLAVSVIAYIYFSTSPLNNTQLALVLVGAVTLVMAVIELIRAPWHKTQRPSYPFADTLKRAAIKWLGTMAGIALVRFAWWVLNMYHYDFYAPLFDAWHIVFPYIPPLLAAYILYTEWRLGPDEDHSWHLGMLVLGRKTQWDWSVVRETLFATGIKAFFLPSNFCWLVRMIEEFRGNELAIWHAPWPQIIGTYIDINLLFILIAVTPGYIFGSRLLGTEVKKVDQSWFGWVVTLCAYRPFLPAFFTDWFNYFPYELPGNQSAWMWLTQNSHGLMIVTACVILTTEAFHYWGESIFSLRSSNITNRGIITNGPFRYCKHPIFVAKCVGWCVIGLPFLMGGGVLESTRYTLAFVGVCVIYAMRAWVEERVLSTDPTYVAYATWIDQHGMFASLGRRFPPLSFQWRLQRWQRNGANQ